MLTSNALNFSGAGLEGAVIGIAVLVFFIFRQFSTRRVTSLLNVIAPLALLYFGVQGVGQLDPTGWVLMGSGLSLGIALGFARGTTFRIWTGPDGRPLMRGTAVTLVLWVLTLATKIALTFVEGQLGFGAELGNSAVTFLPAAATLAAQALVVYLRAQDLRFVGLRAS
jgi:hypothetical protein